MRVLITRPRIDAERTAARVTALGHTAAIDPVIEIEALDAKIPRGEFAALLFTSANGVRAVAARNECGALQTLPVFAVGTHTADAAREHGFNRVSVAAGDASSLAQIVTASLAPPARVLHLAGEHRAGDLPGALGRAGISVETVALYHAREADRLREDTAAAFRGGRMDAVLHYSERSAASFVRLGERAGIGEAVRAARHLCLSAAVAGPLKLFGARTEIARMPDEPALLALLGP